MATRAEPKPELLLANWQEELNSANLYRFLATRESDPEHASLLNEMAEAEVRHAGVMERGLTERGVKMPPHRLSFRTRMLKLLARWFGPRVVYPLLQGAEISGTEDYLAQDEGTAALAPDERSHARMLSQLSRGHGERWHRSAGGGTLRASVFGISDGLVSNLSLLMGFAGASADTRLVVLAGLSGLLAGASSMAAGEYVSMKAQRELLERQIELESAELLVSPGEERDELALIYRSKGVPRAEAERLASQLIADPEIALDTLVREELGLNPDELGSPIGAAVGSFLAFAFGAFLPVIPFLFGSAAVNLVASLVLSGVGLFCIGAALSLFTGRSAWLSGGRQLAIGAAAAAITFGLGKVIGVSAG